MTPARPTILPMLAVAMALFGRAHSVCAAEPGCSAPVIDANADFRERYADLLERIRRELAARQDIDACARVELRLKGAVLSAEVTLPDGRTAFRTIARIEDAGPTLQALLLVPARPPIVHAKAAPARGPRPSPLAQVLNRQERGAPSLALPTARTLGFELSVISGARVGDGQYAVGLGARSLIDIQTWLFGFEGRADSYRSLAGGDPETALELALLGGKRLHFGSVALDLTIGPAIAMKGLAFSQTERAAARDGEPPATEPRSEQQHTEPSSGPVPRLLLSARLGFSPRSVFRTFISIDGEFGPTRAPRDSRANIISPRMPSYSIGLALGATVGTP